MEILIKDEQGLDTVLMMDGYSPDERQEAKRTIRLQFRKAANKVFQDVLEIPLPETIVVNLSLNKKDELDGKSSIRLASFNSQMSDIGYLIFTIHELSVRGLLKHEDDTSFKSTVIHEMFHAADIYMLEKNNQMFSRMLNDIYRTYYSCFDFEKNSPITLLKILQLFDHYRAEGIAILGEHLLMNREFGSSDDAIILFRFIFEKAMAMAQIKINGQRENENHFDRLVNDIAYRVAPFILLLVLNKRGDLESEVSHKAWDGLTHGIFELTDDEVKKILRTSINLSLSGYIQGIVCLGNEVAPIRPFLDFCALLQKDREEGNINAFEQLIQEPQSAETFYAAMSNIMGCLIPEEELDELFAGFSKNTLNDPLYPQMEEKVNLLYSYMKNDADPGRKSIAQWALTYLFDDEDLIYDNISCLGYVDDIIVIDYAIRLIKDMEL